MFTGIVDHIAVVEALSTLSEGGACLKLATRFSGLQVGESIAVDGICLTVSAFIDGSFEAKLSPETCIKTGALAFSVGTLLNVERALSLQDRLGGHWVTGHIDTVIDVKQVQHLADFIQIDFSLPFEAIAYVVPKGSVTINGVSLTINDVKTESFSVTLIPETQKRTNLSDLQKESQVRVEWDYIAKIVQRQLVCQK